LRPAFCPLFRPLFGPSRLAAERDGPRGSTRPLPRWLVLAADPLAIPKVY
jgi:hypothetical protein